MPLQLSLKVGEPFYVGDDEVVVDSIESPFAFTLRRMRDNKLIPIDDDREVEIFKGVFVIAGWRGQFGLARVRIRAPKSIYLGRSRRRP